MGKHKRALMITHGAQLAVALELPKQVPGGAVEELRRPARRRRVQTHGVAYTLANLLASLSRNVASNGDGAGEGRLGGKTKREAAISPPYKAAHHREAQWGTSVAENPGKEKKKTGRRRKDT